MQLSDGRVFFAGGNVTGSGSGGGLNATYVFDPVAASGAVAPDAGPFSTFGWEFDLVGAPEPDFALRSTPSATYDRWYPTLTALPDGRVLIAGGESRFGVSPPAVLTRALEVYDPILNTMQVLPGGEDAWFPYEEPCPPGVVPPHQCFYYYCMWCPDQGTNEPWKESGQNKYCHLPGYEDGD